MISAIRHTRGCRAVGDQDDVTLAFSRNGHFYNRGIKVNSVGDNFNGDSRIRQRFSDDSGVAMVQRPHSIEKVGRVFGTGVHRRPSCFEISVGMSEAHAYASPGRLRDQFDCALQFRSDGHDANMPAGRLPKLFEDFQRRDH